MTTTIYVPDERLFKAADAIAAGLEPCAWSGKVERDQILLALIEIADVAPESTRESEWL